MKKQLVYFALAVALLIAVCIPRAVIARDVDPAAPTPTPSQLESLLARSAFAKWHTLENTGGGQSYPNPAPEERRFHIFPGFRGK